METDARKGRYTQAELIKDIPLTVFTTMDVYEMTPCYTCNQPQGARCRSKSGLQATNSHGTRVHIARTLRAEQYKKGEIDAHGRTVQSEE